MDDFFISTGDDLLLGGHDGVILGGDDNLLSESETLVGPQGPPGPPGQPGKDGRDGADGQNATVSVGTTTTGAPGTSASVVNTGTTQNAVFNFTIPSGATGEQGPAGIDGIDGVDGFSPIASVEQTEYGAEITITDSNGTTTAQIVNGSQGEPGTPGTPGEAATITVGSTTTGAAGTSASVVNSGTSSAAVLDFVIPQGANGQNGYTPVITATAAVNAATGTPYVNVYKTGTDEYPLFDFAFGNLKGEPGIVDWTSSDFTSSINFSVGYANASFRKVGNLVIFFYQSARTNFSYGTTLFELPSGYRPASVQGSDNQFWFSGQFDDAGVCRCYCELSTGLVKCGTNGSNYRIYLQGCYLTG